MTDLILSIREIDDFSEIYTEEEAIQKPMLQKPLVQTTIDRTTIIDSSTQTSPEHPPLSAIYTIFSKVCCPYVATRISKWN